MDQLIAQVNDGVIYQGGNIVLQNVNLKLYKGEFTYLIGKTGSGKSSLLQMLFGSLPLVKGRGMVAGMDLSKLSHKNIPLLRRKLGMIFQDFNLLMDRTVEQNLKFVLKATDWRSRKQMKMRIDEVLELVGLNKMHSRKPFELSGGEQQRVAIARSILNKPQLILADEPTGQLDPDTADEILKLIRSLSKHSNTAVLFATHDYRVIKKYPARIMKCENSLLNVEPVYTMA